jgi:hypothetical protein
MRRNYLVATFVAFVVFLALSPKIRSQLALPIPITTQSSASTSIWCS